MMDDQRDKKLDFIKNQAKLLRQSFDSVQIFCTKDEPVEEQTSSFSWGEGNWFTRYGQVKEWTKKEENSRQ